MMSHPRMQKLYLRLLDLFKSLHVTDRFKAFLCMKVSKISVDSLVDYCYI